MQSTEDKKMRLSYPADSWQQGFLLGNGAMGQVILGQRQQETVELSEITFFSGEEPVEVYRDNAKEAFRKLRQAAVCGEYKEVSALTEQFMGMRGNYGTNLPVGKLFLSFAGEVQIEDDGYERVLNLEEGIAGISFGKGSIEREAFTSHPDKVFAYALRNQTENGMDVRITFDGGRLPYHTFLREDAYCFEVCARESLHSDAASGVTLIGMVTVKTREGTAAVTEEGIHIVGAQEAVLYAAMETDFNLSGTGKKIDRQQIYERVNHSLEEYPLIRERHRMDVASLMNRQELHLGEDNSLTECMYQYGRYLLLSSSREDSKLPAHLQGVWNDDVACRIGWTCDMHLDINTQMNYWISEAGNLPECHKPLFAWMEQRLIPQGRRNADICYGMPGWAAELVTNAWGYAAPYWHKSLSPCPTGGIWQASDYMEHYRYTQDKVFLEKQAYPVIREAVVFFLAYLLEDTEGGVVCGPSISPENAFMVDGEKQYASLNCTYEVLMIRELFEQFLEICGLLSCDGELAEKVKDMHDRLPPYRVLSDGTLAEWAHDFPSADAQHRHTSHLLGVFPYGQITPKDTPALAEAAARTMDKKLTPYENWEDTGWARSLLALYSARLGKGREAHRHLKSMQDTLTSPNLLVMHPPTRGAGSFREVYELDGNTGFAMSVAEMLIQSHNGSIHLLPALPEEWKNGSLKGFPVRGGIVVDMEWKDSIPVQISVTSKEDVEAVFNFEEKYCKVSLQKDAATNITI